MVETERYHCTRCRAVVPHRFVPGAPPALRCASCGWEIAVQLTIPRAEYIFTPMELARLVYVRWEYQQGRR